MRLDRTQALTRDRGFTMLEALIAILILSIGLLGLAGIFVSGAQYTKSANLRTLATQLAYDMADRMRANVPALMILNPAKPWYHMPTAVHTNCYQAAPICTSQQMAQNDFYEWIDPASPSSVKSVLPNGNGIICLDSTPNDGTWDGTTLTDGCDELGTMYAIKVWWLDDRKNNSYQRFVTSLQPQP